MLGCGQGRAPSRCGCSSHLTTGQRAGGRADAAAACEGMGEEAVWQSRQRTAAQVRQWRRLWELSGVQTAQGSVTDEVGLRERETSGGPCASDM